MVLSESQLRDVIERAVRVLPEKTGVTVAELREIAAELDIDPRALERALDDVIGLPIPGQPVRTWLKRQITKLGRLTDRVLPQTGRLATFGLLGAIAGWLNAFLMVFALNGHYPIAAAMLGLTLANLLSRRLDKNFSRYLAETFAQWGCYAVLWSLTYGNVTQNLVIWFVLWTALASAAGWFMVRDRDNDGQYTPSLPQSSPDTAMPGAQDPNSARRERISHRRFTWPTLLRPSQV
jgi:hypothetical protein